MWKYFKWSFITTLLGLACAFFWGENIIPGSGLKSVLIAVFLGILEITLSFDNAVINATKLKKMSQFWRNIFLGIGILIAVFGVRLLLPIGIVSVFSHQSVLNVFKMALEDVSQYTTYLEMAHTPLVAFGGIFLLMIYLSFFICQEKETMWLKPIEEKLSKLKNVQAIEVVIALFTTVALSNIVPNEQKLPVIMSCIGAIITFLLINGLCNMLENFTAKKNMAEDIARMGFFNFLYLEIIDASFSFDGILGAFAISRDVIIIMIGLGIGAMFVRSLTIFMVEKKALEKFVFLEHGAHWAIGLLAIIMFVSIKMEVPEWFTGLSSLGIISASFINSIYLTKQTEKE